MTDFRIMTNFFNSTLSGQSRQQQHQSSNQVFSHVSNSNADFTNRFDVIKEMYIVSNYGRYVKLTFQDYIDQDMQNYRLGKTIQNDFFVGKKDFGKTLNNVFGDFVKTCCLFRDYGIDRPESLKKRSEIMIKMINRDYDDEYKDGTLQRIDEVQRQYDSVSLNVIERKKLLLKQDNALQSSQFSHRRLSQSALSSNAIASTTIISLFDQSEQSQQYSQRFMQQSFMRRFMQSISMQSIFMQQIFPQDQFLLQQQNLYVSQDVRNQSIHSYMQSAQYRSSYVSSHFESISISTAVVFDVRYSKELTQFDKLYKNENKFEKTKNNFAFKLSIFYDKCKLIDLFVETHFENVSIMLSSQTQIYFYVNREFMISFNDFCRKMRLFFENLEGKRLNLIKGQTISLADIISANPILFIIDCLRKMCIEINKIQRNINFAYHDFVHLRENIIRIYRKHSTFAIDLIQFFLKTSKMINVMYDSIINYEIVHKSISTWHHVHDVDENDDDEMYFTNRQYRYAAEWVGYYSDPYLRFGSDFSRVGSLADRFLDESIFGRVGSLTNLFNDKGIFIPQGRIQRKNNIIAFDTKLFFFHFNVCTEYNHHL